MNLKEKYIKNWVKLLILVLPTVFVALEVFRTGLIDWTIINGYMPTMNFANAIMNLLNSVGIVANSFGTFAVSYMVYVVLVELGFVILSFILWLPRLFQNFMNKAGDVGEL